MLLSLTLVVRFLVKTIVKLILLTFLLLTGLVRAPIKATRYNLLLRMSHQTSSNTSLVSLVITLLNVLGKHKSGYNLARHVSTSIQDARTFHMRLRTDNGSMGRDHIRDLRSA